jgi:hypothetical protein
VASGLLTGLTSKLVIKYRRTKRSKRRDICRLGSCLLYVERLYIQSIEDMAQDELRVRGVGSWI